ncbi:MAG TPA: patatin-like phospholipase family protein [Polyangiaceae bacterium]|nr:patatin-like phospholipase family protein [Polyangiaceae bacterium]
MMRSGLIALILAGGAARGAYEVGVVRHILTEVVKDIGRPVPFDILCGTSVGAINACTLAAHAESTLERVEILDQQWKGLRLDQVARPSRSEILGLFGSMVGRKRKPPGPDEIRRGGLIDPRGIEDIVRQVISPGGIRRNIEAGRVKALTVSTTDVSSGRTVIFLQRKEHTPPKWSRDPTISVRATQISAEHALASAAVPLLFPAVRIDGDFYCDGGLRQNVPLSPARRLGADGLIVVNPRYIPAELPALDLARERQRDYPGPLFLFGKALNALLLDRIDADIDRLHRINLILEAGVRRFGPTFVPELNKELGDKRVHGLKRLRVVHIRASADIGALAAEYVRSPDFNGRASGMIASVIRRISEWEGAGEADLLSYILFDGEFAARLIELGRNDARARHAELCAFFDDLAPRESLRPKSSS